MSGTALTTFSPSSSRSTRSTPCVEGCCGPMLRTIVFVAPAAVSTVVMGCQSAERNLVPFQPNRPRNANAYPVQVASNGPNGHFLHRVGTALAFALRRKITAERKTFEAIGQEDAAQVRMAGKLDAKEVENLALQPVGAGPDGLQRIHHGMLDADAGAQANTVAPRNGDQMIVQLEAGLDGVAVNAGGVAQQIEQQGGVPFTFLSRGAQQLFRDDDGRLPAILDHLGDRLHVPGTKAFDNNMSACVGELRHLNNVLKSLRWRYFRDLCQSSAPFFQR